MVESGRITLAIETGGDHRRRARVNADLLSTVKRVVEIAVTTRPTDLGHSNVLCAEAEIPGYWDV
jgi:hypothetical protein